MGHDPRVLAQEKSYFLVLTLGNMPIPFIAAISGFYSGLGRTRLVMGANLIGNGLNIALDPWFIWGGWGLPEMGIVGAGLATAFSQCVVLIILIVAVFKERHLASLQRIKVAFAFKPQLIGRIIRFGIPSGAHVFLDCATFTVFVFLTGRMGELDFAVSNIAFSINHLIFGPLLGVSMASSIVVGQKMGEGNTHDAARAGWLSLLIAGIYIALCILVIGCFNHAILKTFLPPDATFTSEAYFHLGRILVAIFLAWALFDAVNMVIGGALKGAGDTRYCLWAIVVILVGFWIPALFLAYGYWGIVEMWLSLLIYIILLATAYGLRFARGKWKTIRLIH
jgi:MATE family multidrug resistance protein